MFLDVCKQFIYGSSAACYFSHYHPNTPSHAYFIQKVNGKIILHSAYPGGSVGLCKLALPYRAIEQYVKYSNVIVSSYVYLNTTTVQQNMYRNITKIALFWH